MLYGAVKTPQEQDRRDKDAHGHAIQQKGPSPEAMQVACQDLSNQIALATAEGAKEISITGYSDDLIQCMEKERGSISELIDYLHE